mgnify:CR=1 FL=1
MEIDDTMGKGKLIDEIFGEFCEGNYIQPTFITDYPIEKNKIKKVANKLRRGQVNNVKKEIKENYEIGIEYYQEIEKHEN